MKKQLTTTFAMVVMGVAFVGCEHDMDKYNGGTPEHRKELQEQRLELVKAEYGAVFEVTFGRVGKDVDWGFNNDQSGTRAATKPKYRVIAEDFEAKNETDFDFNDVVFDVIGVEGDQTRLKLLAAGGIYRLTVGGIEIHEAFGVKANENGTYPMVSAGGDYNYDPVEILIKGQYETPEQIKDIDIKVFKPGFEEEGIPLEAQKGKPACKILVDETFKVIDERQSVSKDNTNFSGYVQGTYKERIWWKQN